jgi:hypothetical protein
MNGIYCYKMQPTYFTTTVELWTHSIRKCDFCMGDYNNKHQSSISQTNTQTKLIIYILTNKWPYSQTAK